MSNRENSRLKTVSLVIIITLIGKVMGLGREMLTAHSFGTGREAEAWTAASLLPSTFFNVVFASAVSASFIPVFNEALAQRGREEAMGLSNSFFTLVGLAAMLLTALGMLFSPFLIALSTNFDDPQTIALSARLLRIVFPSLFFTGIAFSMVGVLNSFGEFNVPAAMSIASNGILIVYFLFFVDRFGVYGAAAALLVGWTVQAVMQVPGLKKKGYRYRLRLWHPGLKKIFKLMLPVMVSTWVLPINLFVGVFIFASALPGGAPSLLWANQLFIMIAGIFVLSVTNVIFPEMSRLSASGNRVPFRDMIRDTTKTLLFLLLPMTAGLMLLSTPLIQLLFEYRQFDEASTRLLAPALFFMCIGMVGYGVQNVLIRAFYAEKRGRVPMISGLVSIVVNALLCYFLVDAMGVSGLALASALSLLTAALVLLPPAHKMLGGGLITKAMFRALGKMAVSALLMALAVFFLRELLFAGLGGGVLSRFILVGLPAFAGIVIYMALARLLGIEEAKTVFALIRRGRKGEE